MSRFIEKMLENDIDTANDHLPTQKVCLATLLKEEKPSYLTRGGENSRFLVEEIAHLAEEIPLEHHSSFMLPIVILRRMDLGIGIYTIAGSKTELFLVHKMLGQNPIDWTQLRSWRPIDKLARPQVQIIRKKLPSTTCLGFTTSISSGDDVQRT
ncbi:MAG: DUF61 family protein [Candidatus Thorarchaeota archaeon]